MPECIVYIRTSYGMTHQVPYLRLVTQGHIEGNKACAALRSIPVDSVPRQASVHYYTVISVTLSQLPPVTGFPSRCQQPPSATTTKINHNLYTLQMDAVDWGCQATSHPSGFISSISIVSGIGEPQECSDCSSGSKSFVRFVATSAKALE